tara:strand:- start:6125 stop:6631 length:507 start_codon:yes stop_codon:yes gene_type:complete
MAQTEEQYYEVIQIKSNFEIRYYPPVMMAAYDAQGGNSSGFRSLFRYISGSNMSETKIAMTTPVHMEKKRNGNSMAFVLPKKFNSETTPQPKESRVRVYEAEGGYFASFRYSGYTNPSKEKIHTETLMRNLKGEGIEIAGSPRIFVYDAPYSFINRRNEISIPIVWLP